MPKKPVKKIVKKSKGPALDIIVIGDSTLDTFLRVEKASVLCNIQKDKCLLCLNYADKIPVKAMHKAIGGNAVNVAVGTARLGLNSAIYTELGEDDTGKKIKADLKKYKVKPTYVKTNPKSISNYSVVINFEGERTILTYHAKRTYCLPKLAPAKFMYLTSMGKGCERLYGDIIDYVKKYDVKMCFGPGTFQRKSGLKKLKKVVRASHCFISNKEEAQEIFEYPQADDVKETEYMKLLLHKVHLAGPDVVVITDSRRGAYAYDGDSYFYMPIVDSVKSTFPTGAGDSFSSGFIGAIANNKTVSEALRWGAFNSTGVIQKVGPHNGLLNKTEMKEYYKKYKKVISKEI